MADKLIEKFVVSNEGHPDGPVGTTIESYCDDIDPTVSHRVITPPNVMLQPGTPIVVNGRTITGKVEPEPTPAPVEVVPEPEPTAAAEGMTAQPEPEVGDAHEGLQKPGVDATQAPEQSVAPEPDPEPEPDVPSTPPKENPVHEAPKKSQEATEPKSK